MEDNRWDWLHKTITISREEFAIIVAKEMHKVLNAADVALDDKEMTDIITELLAEFSASLAVKMFDTEEDKGENL